jgi:ankyrin repeat protein
MMKFDEIGDGSRTILFLMDGFSLILWRREGNMRRLYCVLSVVVLLLLIVPFLQAQDLFDEIRQGRLESVKTIVEKDPGSLHKRQFGIFPLHQAVRSGQQEIAEFLISKGADINQFAKSITEFAPFEFTPVTEAIRTHRFALLKFFVEKGADLNKVTSLGESYLHYAALMNQADVAAYLIEAGLDVNIKKNGDLSPLHIAAVTGHEEVAKVLIAKGADLDSRSTDGGTPLHFAQAAGHDNIAVLLMSKGAKTVPRNFPLYRGKYLGEKKPGLTPEPFAPELFRDIYRVHSTPAFSPNGKEVFWECIFLQGNNSVSRVWYMKEENGRWTEPRVAPFCKYPSGGPAFFHDGNRLLYDSTRPRDGGTTPAQDLDLWIVERQGDSWGEPKHLDTPLNKAGSFEVYPYVASDGTIYLGTGRREGFVKSDYSEGQYSEPVVIGDLFATDVVDGCKAMKRIFFFSDRGRDERFEYEVHVSFHQPNGQWGKPINLGERLHPGRRGTQAIVTFDGRHLFFTSYFQYYWVDAQILEDLEKSEVAETKIIPGSCTIFMASHGNTVLYGNNEDYMLTKTFYWVRLPTEKTYGGIYYGHQADEDIRAYGPDYIPPQGGVNEKGLAFDYAGLPEAPLNPHPERLPLGHITMEIQKYCATVEEAIAFALKRNWGSSLGWQVLLADASGDAVIISAGADREIAFTRKPPGDGYLITTNFNRANPQNTFQGSYPCRRYNKTDGMLDKISQEEDLTVRCFQSILDAVHAEGPVGNTEYSSVIDLKKGIVYLNHWHQFNETAVLVVAKEIEKHKDLAPVMAEGTKQSLLMPIEGLFSPRTVNASVKERQKYKNRKR